MTPTELAKRYPPAAMSGAAAILGMLSNRELVATLERGIRADDGTAVNHCREEMLRRSTARAAAAATAARAADRRAAT